MCSKTFLMAFFCSICARNLLQHPHHLHCYTNDLNIIAVVLVSERSGP